MAIFIPKNIVLAVGKGIAFNFWVLFELCHVLLGSRGFDIKARRLVTRLQKLQVLSAKITIISARPG